MCVVSVCCVATDYVYGDVAAKLLENIFIANITCVIVIVSISSMFVQPVFFFICSHCFQLQFFFVLVF